MKKLFPLLLLVFSFSIASADSAWVVVKKSTIKEKPSFLSPILATVNYKDELDLKDKENTWWKVSNEDASGWMHKSALSEKDFETGKKKGPSKLVKALSFFGNISGSSDDDGGGGISFDQARSLSETDNTDDVTLAGKGFNKKVEGIYRQENESVNYEAVDLMESGQVELDSIKQFASNGQLAARKLPSETEKQDSSSGLDALGDY